MSIKVNSVVVIDNDRNFSVGVVTVSTISANEFIGTGDKLIFSPSATSFSPTSGATDVSLTPTISITFDQPIYAGVGTITLRNSSGIGTIIESIGIGSTLINNQTLSITPSSSLPINTDVYVVLPEGVVTNAVGGVNTLLDTYNFTTLNFALSSSDPTDGATNIGLSTNITLTFTAAPTQGTGTIELKSGSVDGPIVESFNAASSPRISINGNSWILDPTSNLSFNTTYYPIIPSTAIQNYAGLNTTGASNYSFTTRALALGDAYEGGNLICQSGGVRWVVAPSAAQVCRTWHSRGDANTLAQSVSGCSGWFVPTCSQLKNPGAVCSTYWENTPSAIMWSNTEINGSYAWSINIPPGGAYSFFTKGTTLTLRSFRCVTY